MMTAGAAQVKVIAPYFDGAAFTQTDVFGSAVWLWMHSQSHRAMPLHTLSTLLLPAIKLCQFVLISENAKPVGYLSWANFSEAAERRYLEQNSLLMPENDWNCGERCWILDWVTPFGHSRVLRNLVCRKLFFNRGFRALYHRGEARGLRVLTFHGLAVSKEEAAIWQHAHPLSFAQQVRNNSSRGT